MDRIVVRSRFVARAKRAPAVARVAMLAVCVVLALGCDARTVPLGPSPSPSARRVVVLGDSLAVTPTVEQSFPSVLQTRIDNQGLRWTITNAGVRGDTTSGGLRRMEPLLTSDVGVLVAELGANDGLEGVDIATMRSNLSTIIDAARRRGIRGPRCG